MASSNFAPDVSQNQMGKYCVNILEPWNMRNTHVKSEGPFEGQRGLGCLFQSEQVNWMLKWVED